MVEPLTGWRHVQATDRRTKLDFAEAVRWLVEERYANVAYVRVVLDNLNTHRPAALYEAFPAEQARAIAARVEFHYTPKHGSWLNQAEIDTRCIALPSLAEWGTLDTASGGQGVALPAPAGRRPLPKSWNQIPVISVGEGAEPLIRR